MAKIMALPPIPGVRDLQTLMAFIMNKEEYDARLEALVALQEEIHTLIGKAGKAQDLDALLSSAMRKDAEASTTLENARLKAKQEAVDILQAACTVYGAWVTNTATSTRWLKFYNATAASVTVGTTTPVITIGIPGNTSDDISANFGPGGMGVGFSTACTVASTTGVADADTGAPAANDVIVNIFYKA
jgi:hypothetical protein